MDLLLILFFWTSNRIANTQAKLRTTPPRIANKQNYEQTGVSDQLRGIQGTKSHAKLPARHPPFSSFSSFFHGPGLSSKALVLLVRTQICHFRRFRQNLLFLAGDKSTVYQTYRLWDPEVLKEPRFGKGMSAERSNFQNPAVR